MILNPNTFRRCDRIKIYMKICSKNDLFFSSYFEVKDTKLGAPNESNFFHESNEKCSSIAQKRIAAKATFRISYNRHNDFSHFYQAILENSKEQKKRNDRYCFRIEINVNRLERLKKNAIVEFSLYLFIKIRHEQ